MFTRFIVGCLLLTLSPNCVWSQQFRVETEVSVEGEATPVSKSLTLFDGPLVYDFLMVLDDYSVASSRDAKFQVEEVVVFDRSQQRIILLDQKHKHQMEVGHVELLGMSAAMKASEAMRAKDLFLLEPKLDASLDDAKNEIVLSSERLTYRCKGNAISDTKSLVSYYQFADWAARLNVTDSRKMPPFARLQLNQAIQKRGWLPTEVRLELKTKEGQVFSAVAKHHTIMRLSENDQTRIASVKKQLMDFPVVKLIEYRGLTKPSEN